MRLLSKLAAYAVVGLLNFAAPTVQGQTDYPSRPVRLVVPFPPGGAPDILARLYAEPIGQAWGQTIVVDNRAGVQGMIGAELVAKSAPDGYTLLMAPTSTLCITPHVIGKAPFQAERDFAPGALTATAIALLVVANTVPARTLKELIDLARSQPGKIAYASPGPGSVPHIAGEMLNAAARVDLLHVPYKGSGQIIPDIVAGRVATMFTPLAPVAPLIADGRLRALAVTAAKRSAALPAVPTFAESGIAGMEIEGWYAIFGPAGMQRHIAVKLNAEVARIMATEPVRARYAQLGLDPATASPDELGTMLKRDSARWAQVIRSRGIRAD